jgi:predicted HTH transcriptional regulator
LLWDDDSEVNDAWGCDCGYPIDNIFPTYEQETMNQKLDVEARRRSVANRNAVYHDTPETHRFGMRERIMAYMQEHGPSTREEVADALGKPVHQISGRFTALLNAGLLEETDQKRPTHTGHQAVVLRIPEPTPESQSDGMQ